MTMTKDEMVINSKHVRTIYLIKWELHPRRAEILCFVQYWICAMRRATAQKDIRPCFPILLLLSSSSPLAPSTFPSVHKQNTVRIYSGSPALINHMHLSKVKSQH